MDACYACGGRERLRQVWAFDHDAWFQCPGDNFLTPQHTSHRWFCRHCIRNFDRCRCCGDTAAWCDPSNVDCTDVCANPFRTCWPQHWDEAVLNANGDASKLPYGTLAFLEEHEVESFVELWPGDGTDPLASSESDDSDDDAPADEYTCCACDTQVAASEAVTYHRDGSTYCLGCFREELDDPDSLGQLA